MQRTLTLVLLASLFASSAAFAQPASDRVLVTGGAFGFPSRISAAPVQGAPYSGTITNESIQTLADGNRIVQTSTGTTARDSMGRTRQDAALPAIGNLAPADAPRLVFLQDPVAQVSYTLNLTDKTAMKGPSFSGMMAPGLSASVSTGGAFGSTIAIRGIGGPATAAPVQSQTVMIHKGAIAEEGQAQTEDLGSKTMEGVAVTGTRITHTIPAGQIGNDKPLNIVTEVWTSPELKTVVYSTRTDPRMGDQTFQLTNIVRSEPDPSLFTIPADFKILDAPEPIMYKTSGVPAQ
jgi:hypothetical protein